jgi:peptide/nickel transport system substrate-binding protein
LNANLSRRAALRLVAATLVAGCGRPAPDAPAIPTPIPAFTPIALGPTPATPTPAPTPTVQSVGTPVIVRGGALRVVLAREPAGLGPFAPNGDAALTLNSAIFDTLVRLDPGSGKVIPWLASEWRRESDTAWLFTLRPRVVFHGRHGELTAEDVAFTFGELRRRGIGTTAVPIRSADVVDRHVVRVVLERPYAAFLATIGANVGIASAAGARQSRSRVEFEPVGTGPFAVAEWVGGDRILLARTGAYWRSGIPLVDEVHVSFLEDARERSRRLRLGMYDVAIAPPEQDHAMLAAGPTTRLHSASGWGWVQLGLNSIRWPLDRREIRQAIGHAVDRRAVVDGVFFGAATAVDMPLYAPFADPVATLWRHAPTQDLERARQLLGRGSTGRFDVSLTLATRDDPRLNRIAQSLAGQLGRVGIRLQISALRPLEFERAVTGTGARMPFHMELDIVHPTSFDPDEATYPFIRGGAPRWRGHADVQLDQWLDSAREHPDATERVRMYQGIVAKVLEEATHVYVARPNATWATRSVVQAFRIDPRPWEAGLHLPWISR